MTRKKSEPPRAKKGTVEPMLIRLEPLLREHVEAGAKREGVTLVEWIRRACRERVLREAAPYRAKKG